MIMINGIGLIAGMSLSVLSTAETTGSAVAHVENRNERMQATCAETTTSIHSCGAEVSV